MTEIFFVVLIPRFGCFGVTYVTLCLKFKGLSETFFKNTKWSVNTFQQQQKKLHPCINDFREISFN